MKRIDRCQAASAAADHSSRDPVGLARYEPASATRHAVFAPMHYEPNYAYPLLIWLHGWGDSETQLRRIMPIVSMRNYVAVAPRGTVAVAGRTHPAGFGWCQDEDGVVLAGAHVADCIAQVRQRFHLATNRIFLAGYAEGGSMALRLALIEPHSFAGAASLGGAFPTGNCPLRHLDNARRLPLLLATARDSVRCSEQQAVGALRLLHAAGMSLTLRQYPGGDDLTQGMLTDLDRWIMKQVCPSCAGSLDEAGV
ncbi:MAG: hypothetical protein A2W31_05965 [Planctomycetes bacterium RBG_16_64_10]|nr:MAG: hypothetical protein A2W31_05965 [Planctomycetes bacterium RBG_16_64_10]